VIPGDVLARIDDDQLWGDLPQGCHPRQSQSREVAKVSPRVAECDCELVQSGELAGREIVTALDDVLVPSRALGSKPRRR
jgi:hypothetical protein